MIKYLTKKRKLKKPIDNDHTYCLLCEKVYPTQESLEFHLEAVHKTGMSKHRMEREPRLAIKIKVEKSWHPV